MFNTRDLVGEGRFVGREGGDAARRIEGMGVGLVMLTCGGPAGSSIRSRGRGVPRPRLPRGGREGGEDGMRAVRGANDVSKGINKSFSRILVKNTGAIYYCCSSGALPTSNSY